MCVNEGQFPGTVPRRLLSLLISVRRFSNHGDFPRYKGIDLEKLFGKGKRVSEIKSSVLADIRLAELDIATLTQKIETLSQKNEFIQKEMIAVNTSYLATTT